MLISGEGLHSTEQYFIWRIVLVLAVTVCPLTFSNQSCLPPSSFTLFYVYIYMYFLPDIFHRPFCSCPRSGEWFWAGYSCPCSVCRLQPKTGKQQAKKKAQVKPVLGVPGLFSAGSPQNTGGTPPTSTEKTGGHTGGHTGGQCVKLPNKI